MNYFSTKSDFKRALEVGTLEDFLKRDLKACQEEAKEEAKMMAQEIQKEREYFIKSGQ